MIETGRYFFKYIVSFSPDRLYNGQPVTEPVYAILAPERHDLVGFALKFPGKAFGDVVRGRHGRVTQEKDVFLGILRHPLISIVPFPVVFGRGLVLILLPGLRKYLHELPYEPFCFAAAVFFSPSLYIIPVRDALAYPGMHFSGPGFFGFVLHRSFHIAVHVGHAFLVLPPVFGKGGLMIAHKDPFVILDRGSLDPLAALLFPSLVQYPAVIRDGDYDSRLTAACPSEREVPVEDRRSHEFPEDILPFLLRAVRELFP